MERATTNINIAIPIVLLSSVKEQAEKMGVPYSSVIRMACTEFIDRHNRKRK